MRLFQHRVEHRREIAGRGVDDLQYLGGRGLLLQRLARLGDQPRVLHRDDRLRGEVLQQRDLLVGKRPHLPAVDDDRAEQACVLAQRNDQDGACPPSSTSARAVGCRADRVSSADSRRYVTRCSPARSRLCAVPGTRLGRTARRRYSANSCGTPRIAAVAQTTRRHTCHRMPNAASQSRIAFSSIASNTGARSPGEELMTCKHLGGRGLLFQVPRASR